MPPQITPDQARKELARRELERRERQRAARQSIGAQPGAAGTPEATGATLFPGGTAEQSTGVAAAISRAADPRPMGQMVAHPIESFQSIMGASRESGERFIENLKQGNISQAIGTDLPGTIPLLGPAAVGISQRMTGGDVSGGLTELLTFAAPEMLPKVRMRNVPESGPLTKSRGQQSGRGRQAEETVARIPGGRGPFRELEQLQDAEAVQISNNIVESVAQGASRADDVDIGSRFLQSLDTAQERLTAPAREIYNRIDEELGTRTVQGPGGQVARVSAVMPSTNALKEFARPLLARLDDEGALIRGSDLQPVRDTLQRILDAPDRLPFQAFQDARSDLLASARSFTDPLPGKKAGVVRRLASIADESMESALQEAGRTDLLTDMRTANQIWRNTAESLDDKVIKRLMDAQPEAVPGILASAPTDTIRNLKGLIPEETFQDAAAVTLRNEFFDPATQGQVPESILAQQGVSDAAQQAQQRITPKSLNAKLRRSRSRLSELIGTKAANETAELAADLFNIKQRTEGNIIFPLVMSGQILGPLAVAMGGGGLSGAAATSVGLLAATRAVSKYMVSSPGNRQLLRRFLNSDNAREATTLAMVINAGMRETPEMILSRDAEQ